MHHLGYAQQGHARDTVAAWLVGAALGHLPREASCGMGRATALLSRSPMCPKPRHCGLAGGAAEWLSFREKLGSGVWSHAASLAYFILGRGQERQVTCSQHPVGCWSQGSKWGQGGLVGRHLGLGLLSQLIIVCGHPCKADLLSESRQCTAPRVERLISEILPLYLASARSTSGCRGEHTSGAFCLYCLCQWHTQN